MRLRRLWLLLWIIGILFPMAWLRQNPAFRRAFDAVFSPDWMHVIMHAALYTGLAILLFIVFRWKPGWRTLGFTLLAALAVGIVQEGLQSISQGYWPWWGIGFDLVVDMTGGAAGWLLMVLLKRRQGFRENL